MLRQRLLTALILAPVALWGLFYLSGLSFALFTGLVIGIAAWEWARLSQLPPLGQLLYPAAILALLASAYHQPHLQYQALWIAAIWWPLALILVMTHPRWVSWWRCPARRAFLGLMVLLPAWCGLQILRVDGIFWLLYVLLLTWIADIGAYFAGRAFGRRKLAPAVSPGKSWEGVYGGLLGTSLLSLSAGYYLHYAWPEMLQLWLITLLITAASVLGDLMESLIKREAGMKDSSQLLPGHGGFMDRIDSLTSAVPLFALLLLYGGL